MLSFHLSYDYRCPFAKNLHLHVIEALRAGADFDVTFVPWTMSQGYGASGAPDVWEDPSRDAELLSLAVSVSVRDLQPEHFLDAHEALFRARHERAIRLVTDDEIRDASATTASSSAPVERPRFTSTPKVIGECFREFERYEAFGVPTFVVNERRHVRPLYEPFPVTPASRSDSSTRLVTLMSDESDLNEFKHTKVPM